MTTKPFDQPVETRSQSTKPEDANSKWNLSNSSLTDVRALNQQQDRTLQNKLIPQLELMMDDPSSAAPKRTSGSSDDLEARVKNCDERKVGERTSYYDKTTGDLMGWRSNGKLYVIEWNGENMQRVLGSNGHVLEYEPNRNLADGQWQWKNEKGIVINSTRWQNCFIQTDESGAVVNRFPGAVTREMMRDLSVASYADLPAIAENMSQTITDMRNSNSRNGALTLALELLQLAPDKLQQLALQYQSKTGHRLADDIDALARDGYIGQPMNTYLQKIMETGSRERTPQQIADLAKLALSVDSDKWFWNQKTDKIALLRATIGGADANSVEARRLFLEQQGDQLLTTTFGDKGTEIDQSRDILQNGRISALTQFHADNTYPWVATNENSLRTYISSMSEEERQKYLKGRDLVTSGRTEFNDPEEKSAAEFYTKLDKEMRDASFYTNGFIARRLNNNDQNLRVYYGLVDQIQTGREDGLISKITKARDNFAGVSDAISNMTEDEYKRIRFDKKYEQQVRNAINATFFDGNGSDNFRAHQLINDIQAKPNYKDISKYGADKLYSKLDQNFQNPQGIADSVDNADSQAIERMRKDPEYLQRLQKRANAFTAENSPERELVTYELNLYKSGRQRDALDNLTIDVLKMQYGGARRAEIIARVAAAVKSDAALSSALKSDERGALVLKYLRNATGNDEISEKVVAGKRLSSTDLFSLTSYKDTKAEAKTGELRPETTVTKTNSDDMFALLPYSDAAQMDKSGLSNEQRKVADSVDAQQEVRPEDHLRLLALKGNVEWKSVEAIVGKMSDPEKTRLLTSYAAKYGVLAKESLMRVAASDLDREHIRQLLSPAPKTMVGVISNQLRQNSVVTNVTDTGAALTNFLSGGDSFSVANQQSGNAAEISRTVQKALDKATPEQRTEIQRAVSNLEKAIANVDLSKKDAIKTIETAAFRVTMAVSVVLPFTGPVLTAIGVGVCVATGVSEVVSRRLIEGGKYSSDKALQDGVTLGINLAINLAPYAVSRIFKSSAVAELLKDGMKESDFARDLKAALGKGVSNPAEQESALQAVISKYARQGQEQNLMAELKDSYAKELARTSGAGKQQMRLGNSQEPVSTLSEDQEAVKAMRAKYNDLYVNVEPRAKQDLLNAQGVKFQQNLRLDEKLLDGAVINGVTVDKNEPLIRDLLNYAKSKYGHLPPQQRAEAYTRFAKEAFQQESEGIATTYAKNYRNLTTGKNPYLGDFAKLNSGVCFEESLFLKLLADQHSDWQVSLVGGVSAGSDGFKIAYGGNAKLNHAWTEFKFSPSDTPKIYDPRQLEFGETYDQMLTRMGTTHVPAQKAVVSGMPDAVTVSSQGDKLFQFKAYDPMTGEAIVYEAKTGFVPTVTTFKSVKDLEEAGWISAAPDLYVRNGKACVVKFHPDGTVFMFDTPAIKKFPAQDVAWRFGKPAPVELYSAPVTNPNMSRVTQETTSIGKADKVSFKSEEYDVVDVVDDGDRVLIYQEGRNEGYQSHFQSIADWEIGTKYLPIKIDDVEYLRDLNGNVFVQIKPNLLIQEPQYQVVARNDISVLKRAEKVVPNKSLSKPVTPEVPQPKGVSDVPQASVNGREYEVGKVYTVGRGNSADIQIADSSGRVSREHAIIYTDASGNTYIADIGSGNGTYVNGVKIPVSTDKAKPKWVLVKVTDHVSLGKDFELDLRPPYMPYRWM